MSEIAFYAVAGDLLPVLQELEKTTPLKYVRTGNFLNQQMEVFLQSSELPGLGTATSDAGIGCESFLVCHREAAVREERFLDVKGHPRRCIDQGFNPDTVILTPAGLWAETVVLYGRVATASVSPTSRALMRRFARAFQKHFTKIGGYHVGPRAMELFETGMRLTIATQSPREFDLIRE